jgi:hypothetical protein
MWYWCIPCFSPPTTLHISTVRCAHNPFLKKSSLPELEARALISPSKLLVSLVPSDFSLSLATGDHQWGAPAVLLRSVPPSPLSGEQP